VFKLMLILGGVALLLHGVRTLRKGLDRLFGAQLGLFLQRRSSGPGAIFVGMSMALLAPSSTSVSVLAVQTVRSGHVSARRMLVILLGADIGLTLTVQLLSFNIDHLAPLFLACGVLLYQYTRAIRSRGFGQVLLSLGFLFMGISLIRNGASQIDSQGDLGQILRIAGHNPLWLAALAGALAIALQSSTATVGMLMGLTAPGGLVLTPELAIAAVVGANVGVGITMLMIGWQEIDTRRLALANLLAKASAGAVVLALLGHVAVLLTRMSGSFPRQVADAHTGFNVFKVLVMFPLTGVLMSIVEHLVPSSLARASEDPSKPRFLGLGPTDGNSFALSQSMREILRVAEIVRGMCDDVWRALRDGNERLVKQVSERDNHVDRLEAAIKRFLAGLDAHSLDSDQSMERLRQLQYLTELEAIGDLVDRNLCTLVLKKIRRRVAFSPDAWAELDRLDQQINENMLLADAAFHTRDSELAAKLLRHKDYVDRRVRELRDTQLAALGYGTQDSHDSNAVHLDLLTNMRRVNSHICRVAFALVPGAVTTPPLQAGS
jgi:phosphate:Na+ symporter